MKRLSELVASAQHPHWMVLVMSGVVMIFAWILYVRNAPIFEPFLGKTNPLLAVLAVSLLGIVLMTFLRSRGLFEIHGAATRDGLIRAAGLALPLALVMIAVDLKAVFPADLNSRFPDSVLFYPVIGYVAEVVFHLLPITLLMLAATSLFGTGSPKSAIWPLMAIVAVVEPFVQTALGASRSYPTWLTGYVFFHVYVVNFLQLLIFRRYGFVSMYSFRLVYYIVWHIVWGYARLGVLF